MRNVYIISLFTAASIYGMTACSDAQEPIEVIEEPTPTEFVLKTREDINITPYQQAAINTQNDFAFNCLTHILSNNKENFVFSPLSLSQLLSLASNGLDASAQQKLVEELVGTNFTIDDLNILNKELTDQLLNLDNSSQLGIYNAAWNDISTSFKPAFSSIAKEFYNTGMASFDFSSPSFAKEVNNWINDKSNGLIPSIIEGNTGSDILLANAMYFKGEWTTPFDTSLTTPQTFHNSDNTETLTPMMKIDKDKFFFYYSDLCRMVRLPYGNEAFSLYVMMPSEIGNYDIIKEVLSLENRKDFKNNYYYDPSVEINLPRFDVKSDFKQLSDMIGSKKICEVFENNNNFSQLLDTPFKSEMGIRQQTAFKVDEAGAEGAAVSYGIPSWLDLNSKPTLPVLTFDHPFVFMLEEQSTGAILLMGAINKF